MAHFIVIGAGQAGASLVAKLRLLGHSGEITLIGAEPVPPYQRPPLSKAYLLGQMEEERLFLRPAEFYDEKAITLLTGEAVSAIDAAARTITLGQQVLRYDQLALTTGARPRRLPAAMGGALAGVCTVRSLADVDAIRPEFQPGRRVLIAGGGYVGLEAAAVAASLGLEVTLVEMAPRILQRVAAPETADFFRALHQRHGVRLIEGTGIAALTGTGRVCGATLTSGEELACDFVIAGVGVEPETDLARMAGCRIENGIATDEFGQTSVPGIWAAGDCSSFPHDGGRIRLESVGNAIDQAEIVAANMLGAARPYQARPWFWSDQYDVKLQIAGLNTGYDRVVTRQGDGPVSFWYFRGARLLAVDAMNDPRAYMVGKRLIEAGRSPDPALVAGAADPKDLL